MWKYAKPVYGLPTDAVSRLMSASSLATAKVELEEATGKLNARGMRKYGFVSKGPQNGNGILLIDL